MGEAIAEHGVDASLVRLVDNATAELSRETVEGLARKATDNGVLAARLRGRASAESQRIVADLRDEAGAHDGGEAGAGDLAALGLPDTQATMSRVQAVVYNRIKNRAGFSGEEWKLAWNQVKALADRQRFDIKALHRFTRFGYGHHAAAGLTMLLDVRPEMLVKWLAMQDYVAVTVAARAIALPPEVFSAVFAVMPWRDLPSRADIENVRVRFEALSEEEAVEIFATWRSHSFRRRQSMAR